MGKIPSYKIAITYNLKKGLIQSDVPDEEAEYDSIGTINAISSALVNRGQKVVLLEADLNILQHVTQEKFDIVFNIAEGLHGRAREAFVPSVLTAVQIPFTGSDETTLAVTLDKALCKKVLSYSGIKTPNFCVFYNKNDSLSLKLKYPLIVKPNAEGSGKGISDISVAANEEELYVLTSRIIDLYRQPVLVEEFIRGRELTVSVLGNGADTMLLPPMEIIYKNPGDFNIYNYTVKQNFKQYVRYECPAQLSGQKNAEIMNIALKCFKELQCRDLSRIDFIVEEGTEDVYFLEINPLPGLAPQYSDFPITAEFAGITYDNLIIQILNNALKRYNMTAI